MPTRPSARTLLVSLAAAALSLAPPAPAGAQAPIGDAGAAPPTSVVFLADSAPAFRSPAPPALAAAVAAPAPSRTLVDVAPAGARQERAGRGRAVAWGGLAGAAAGTLTGLAVMAMCGSYCDEVRGRGMAVHIGVGTVLGGAVGALVHRLRD